MVTGATGGLGREIVRALLQEMNVIAIGRSAERLEKLSAELTQPESKFRIITLEYDFSTKPLEEFANTMDSLLAA